MNGAKKSKAGLIVAVVGAVALTAQLKSRNPPKPAASKPKPGTNRSIAQDSRPASPPQAAQAHLSPLPAIPAPEAYKVEIPSIRYIAPVSPSQFPESVRNPKPRKFVQGGDAKNPFIKGENGEVFRLMRLEDGKVDFDQLPPDARARAYDRKIQNKAYRDQLERRPAQGAFLMPFGNSIGELFAGFFGLNDAIAEEAGPESIILEALQTPVRNQYDRGTCQTFAALAVVESAYMLQYGLTLDLSEQFLAHIDKSTTDFRPRRFGSQQTQTSFWSGGAAIYSVRAAQQFGAPLETEINYPFAVEALKPRFPDVKQVNYLGDGFMTELRDKIVFKDNPERGKILSDWTSSAPHMQDVIDEFEYSQSYINDQAHWAARYRVKDYTPIDGATLKDTKKVEQYIRSARPIGVNVIWSLAYNPVTQNHDFVDGGTAGHVVAVIGYSRTTGDGDKDYFVIKNSHGGGPKDYMRMSYNCFRKAVQSGVVVESVHNPELQASPSVRWLGNWSWSNDGWRGRLLIRRFAPDGVPFRVGNYYPDDGTGAVKTVVGVASHGGTTLTMYMHDDPEAPETAQTGQPFVLKMSASGRVGAGYTIWSDLQFGIQVQRGALPVKRAYVPEFVPDSWSGTRWAVDLGFLSMTLEFNKVDPNTLVVTGVSTDQGSNAVESVTASVVPMRPHLLDVIVHRQGSPIKFRLMRFTREEGRAAGIFNDGMNEGILAELI